MTNPLFPFLCFIFALLVLIEITGQVILHGITVVNYLLAKRDRQSIDKFVATMAIAFED